MGGGGGISLTETGETAGPRCSQNAQSLEGDYFSATGNWGVPGVGLVTGLGREALGAVRTMVLGPTWFPLS